MGHLKQPHLCKYIFLDSTIQRYTSSMLDRTSITSKCIVSLFLSFSFFLPLVRYGLAISLLSNRISRDSKSPRYQLRFTSLKRTTCKCRQTRA